jgi:hypothetical protein
MAWRKSLRATAASYRRTSSSASVRVGAVAVGGTLVPRLVGVWAAPVRAEPEHAVDATSNDDAMTTGSKRALPRAARDTSARLQLLTSARLTTDLTSGPPM